MLDSGRQSGFQCLTHNFQRGDCEECSFADRPVPTVARVLHCEPLRPSSMEAEGERETLVQQTPSACFMARPGTRDNMGNRKGPAFLELTV